MTKTQTDFKPETAIQYWRILTVQLVAYATYLIHSSLIGGSTAILTFLSPSKPTWRKKTTKQKQKTACPSSGSLCVRHHFLSFKKLHSKTGFSSDDPILFPSNLFDLTCDQRLSHLRNAETDSSEPSKWEKKHEKKILSRRMMMTQPQWCSSV